MRFGSPWLQQLPLLRCTGVAAALSTPTAAAAAGSEPAAAAATIAAAAIATADAVPKHMPVQWQQPLPGWWRE